MPHASEYTFEDAVEAHLNDLYGEPFVVRQHRFENDRVADFLVFDDDHGRMLAFELENDSGSLPNGVGQALFYAHSAMEEYDEYGGCVPVLCFPDGHIDDEERRILRRTGVILKEFAIPPGVELDGV